MAKEKASSQASGTFLELKRFNEEKEANLMRFRRTKCTESHLIFEKMSKILYGKIVGSSSYDMIGMGIYKSCHKLGLK